MARWKLGWLSWRRTVVLLLAIALGGALAGLVIISAEMILAVFLGVVLAVAVKPVVDFLLKAGISRGLATTLVFLLIAVAGVGAVVVIVPIVRIQLFEFAKAMPHICERALRWAPKGVVSDARATELTLACSTIMVPGPKTSSSALGYVSGLPQFVWNATIILGVAFVWARDRENLLRAASLSFAECRRDAFRQFFESIETRLGGFLRAQFALSAVIALATLAFCLIVGVPQVALVATFAALGEFLPVVGPVFVGAFMLASVLPTKPELALAIFAFCIGLRICVDYLLMPFLVGKTADVNPLLLLLCVLALGTSAGVLGISAATPAAAVLSLLLTLTVGADAQPRAGLDRDKRAMMAYQAHGVALTARRLGKQRISAGLDSSSEDAVESLALEIRREISEGRESIPK